MVYTIATINEDHLNDIAELEKEIGTPLIAMAPVGVAPAKLDREKLDRIQALEEKLGVVLVAVEDGKAA